MAQWRQETILKLIGAYRARRLLWDHNAPDYTDRSKRIYAWKEIADELGCDVMTVERKLKSLKTHFMSVHKAYAKRRLKADLTPGSVIKPKWFAYEALTFLNKGRLTRINRETLNVEKQNPAPAANWKPQVHFNLPCIASLHLHRKNCAKQYYVMQCGGGGALEPPLARPNVRHTRVTG
ncbi:PREDICTED: uncharacterized protein LOC105561312 isoform X2 [Vollenhovia emeryi]|uniref:uncharacterized protein LOC105561312 isoform X2 n=1 Tax=Vollenhovia emeryi TaxID=411798 RepID=UPI0005F3CA73|nr:PREDICTED: uncharacterized protein LOC105561312 isoform X2 [Vollenhovia emeryi]